MSRSTTKHKTKRRSFAFSKQHVSKQCTYALDESRRPKPYGQQLEDGFVLVNPDIW